MTLVKDIDPGGDSSSPASLTDVNGALYFTADDGTHGTELWSSDGTVAGTVLVSDINPGSGYSDPSFLTNVNGTLYFAADDGTHGSELWSFRPALTIARNGGGSGTVTSASGVSCASECSQNYAIADTVTLRATPGSNSIFSGWSGGGCSGTGTCTVTMDSDRTVTANFVLIPHTLTISRAGSGTGTVTSSPSGINCGSSCTQSFAGAVTLQATPGSDSTFTGWSGGGCSGTGTCTITMDSDHAVIATFTANPAQEQPPLVSLTGLGISPRKISTAGREMKHHCVKPAKDNVGSKRCRLAIRVQIMYTLNIPATVEITLGKRVPGRSVSGKCVRPTNRNRRHRKCLLLLKVSGSLKQTGTAGSNSRTWNGKIGARNVRSGTYTLIATSTANGRTGTPQQIRFRILD